MSRILAIAALLIPLWLLVQRHASTASAITYQYALGAGQTLSPGTGWMFAAQSTGSATTHPTGGDTYAVAYRAGGVDYMVTGHF